MRWSQPSLARQLAAGAIMAAGAVYVAAVKLTREGETGFAPMWLAGVLPNLICAAVCPLALFLSRRSIRSRDYWGMILFTTMSLCLYEFAQLGMPRRTFDRYDLGATAVGAMIAVILGVGFFLLTGTRNTLPPAVTVDHESTH